MPDRGRLAIFNGEPSLKGIGLQRDLLSQEATWLCLRPQEDPLGMPDLSGGWGPLAWGRGCRGAVPLGNGPLHVGWGAPWV